MGELVPKDQFQKDLCWGQMKCGGCQLRWHVCLQHILRWLWEDVAKVCHHFRLPCHNLSKTNDPSIHNEYDVIMQEGLSVSCLSSPTVISSDALNPVENGSCCTATLNNTTSEGYGASNHSSSSMKLPSHSKRYVSRESILKGNGIPCLVLVAHFDTTRKVM